MSPFGSIPPYKEGEQPRSPEEVIFSLRKRAAAIFDELRAGGDTAEAKRKLVALINETFDEFTPVKKIEDPQEKHACEVVVSTIWQGLMSPKPDSLSGDVFVFKLLTHLQRYLFENYSREVYDNRFLDRFAQEALDDTP